MMTNQPGISRRALLGIGLGAAAAPALAACGGQSTSGGGGEGSVTFLSTQFTPVEERQRFEKILADKVSSVKVAYNPVEAGVFASTIQSQVEAGKVQIGVVGGLHGDLAPQADRLQDVDDLVGGRQFVPDLLELGKLGGSAQKYIPWMQASYVLAVHKKALQWLPSGADVQKLTYDQLLDWMTAAKAGNGGKPVFGLPAGPKGLYHRFLQGFLLPSFTGGMVTTFRNADAVTAWEYLTQLWAQSVPASTNYDYMQEPLQRGEVLVAWDHVARLIAAPGDKPDDWVMAPAPRGPKGLGYLLVAAGVGIPRGAPDTDRAKELIKALTTTEVQQEVLRKNAFFPVVTADPPGDLPPAVALEAAAVQAQQNADDAILSLPPVGLGAKDGEMSQVFKDCFQQICLNRRPIRQVLDTQARRMNAILDEVKVACWKPDPPGEPCQVQ